MAAAALAWQALRQQFSPSLERQFILAVRAAAQLAPRSKRERESGQRGDDDEHDGGPPSAVVTRRSLNMGPSFPRLTSNAGQLAKLGNQSEGESC